MSDILSKKVFDERMTHLKCHEMFHPWNKSCTGVMFEMIKKSIKGASKFFVIIYVLQILIKGRKLTINFIKEQILMFPRSVLYGCCMATGWITSNCFFRYILGQYYYLTCAFLPGFCGGLGIVFENPKMRNLDFIIFTNMVIQIVINYCSGEGILIRSTVLDTFYFMLCNSVLMYLLNKTSGRKITDLWFFSSLIKSYGTVGKESKENDTNQIWRNIIKESTKFFGGAYVFQTTKLFFTNFKNILKNPTTLFSTIFNKKSLTFGMFFGTYVTIYRVVTSVLNNYNPGSDLNGLISGFLAGSSYYLHPNVPIAVLAVTTILQLIWSNIRKNKEVPFTKQAELIYFGVCTGILFHSYGIMPFYCPRYIHNMVDNCTCDMGPQLIYSFRKSYYRK